MKILHIANFGYNKQGAHFYCTDRKISAGLIENGHFVYDFSFRDMARMGTVFKTKKLGAGWANREVLKIVENLEPDLILIGHSDLMGVDVLAQIKKMHPKIKIAFWYVDPLYIESKLHFIHAFSDYLDAIFCTTGGELLKKFKKNHLKVAYMPNIVHANVETLKQYESKNLVNDFIFCGAIYKEVERENFLKYLASFLDNNSVSYRYYGCFDQKGVFGKEYYNVLKKTQMGLNLSRKNDITLYSSDRIVQLTGNGLLTFSPRIPRFDKLYTDQEIVYFNDQSDLSEKILYYKNQPELAKNIAANGWSKTHLSYNAKRISKFILEVTFGLNQTENYEWQDEVY